MPEQKTPDLWELSDLRTPWCIRVAATLRIADHIAEGIEQIDDLAAITNCDPYALHRVLTLLVNKGLFEEPVPGRFILNEAARGLLDPAQRIGLDLNGIGGRLAYAWGTLPDYVRTGQAAYQQAFGLSFWEDLDSNPEIAASFDALIGPTGHDTPNPDFDLTGGWEAIRTVIDVGGGTGAMLAQILRKWPQIQGTLVDLPRTVALSAEVFHEAGVSERATTLGQSFFDPLPPGADLYLLRGILNDWPDREALAILQRCAEAAQPNGRVVILKGMTTDDAPRELSIEMVLLGGKQRALSEMQAHARQAGLEVLAAGDQSSGYFVMECRPA